jgi:Protein of unknown function (DUF3040)
MLSDHDRRTLAGIERHLQEDPALRRTFGRSPQAFERSWRTTSAIRHVWFVLLATSLVLTVGMAALRVSGAALECAVLAVVIGMALRSTGDQRSGLFRRASGAS